MYGGFWNNHTKYSSLYMFVGKNRVKHYVLLSIQSAMSVCYNLSNIEAPNQGVSVYEK